LGKSAASIEAKRYTGIVLFEKAVLPASFKFPKLPREKIVRTQVLINMLNPEPFERSLKRFVVLACGHTTFTKALHSAHCPRCQQMLDSGYDWDGFRRLGFPDQMSWPKDPCRRLNEPHDLAGNPLR
jgi:hypothetical protein